MSYRNIVVEGVTYKWKVGREFIEIRNTESGNPFSKALVKRPSAVKRWGVIKPNLETDTLMIEIFTSPDLAQKAYESHRKSYEGMEVRKQIELVTLPAKTVSITPEWIKAQILARSEKVAR